MPGIVLVILQAALVVIKQILSMLSKITQWFFSGTDDKKIKRAVLALLFVLSFVKLLTVTDFSAADVKAHGPFKVWNFNKTKPNIPVAASPITQYLDRIVYVNAQGATLNIKHPVEGKVITSTNPDGTMSIYVQRMGLCLVPLLGATTSPSDTIRPFVGARFLYYNNLGLEAGASLKKIMLGPDMRLSIIGCSNYIVSAGPALTYKGGIEGYISLSASADVLHKTKR